MRLLLATLFLNAIRVRCAVIWQSDFNRLGPLANASLINPATFGLKQFGGDNEMHVWSVNALGDLCVQSWDSNVFLVPLVPDSVPRGFFNVTMRRAPGIDPSVNFIVATWTVVRVDDAYRCIGAACAEGRDDHTVWTLPHIAANLFSLGVSWNATPATLADLDYTFNAALVAAPRAANATQLRGATNPWRWSCRWSCNICIASMNVELDPPADHNISHANRYNLHRRYYYNYEFQANSATEDDNDNDNQFPNSVSHGNVFPHDDTTLYANANVNAHANDDVVIFRFHRRARPFSRVHFNFNDNRSLDANGRR